MKEYPKLITKDGRRVHVPDRAAEAKLLDEMKPVKRRPKKAAEKTADE